MFPMEQILGGRESSLEDLSLQMLAWDKISTI